MYVAFFTFLVLGALLAKKSAGKAYFFLMMLLLLAIMGFRSPSVGVDTRGYIEGFGKMAHVSFEQLLMNMQSAREPLHLFYNWLLSCFSSSNIFFLFGYSLFPCVAIYLTVKDELEETQDYMVAILCLFALGFFAFFVAGIRQTTAISLVFLGYRYLKNINFSFNPVSYFNANSFKFALCVVSAYWFHNSALVFLLALPFLKVKIRWWYLPFVVALFFVGSFFTVDFLVQLASLLFNDRFASYGTTYESSQRINGFIMQFLLFLICFFQYPKLQERNQANIVLFNLVLVGLVCQSFSGMIAEMWRVAFYFSIFFLILVPRAIKEYKPPLRSFLYPAFTLLLLLYLFSLSRSQLPDYSSSLL